MVRVTTRPAPRCLCGRRDPSDYFTGGLVAGFMLGMAFAYLGFYLLGGAS